MITYTGQLLYNRSAVELGEGGVRRLYRTLAAKAQTGGKNGRRVYK